MCTRGPYKLGGRRHFEKIRFEVNVASRKNSTPTGGSKRSLTYLKTESETFFMIRYFLSFGIDFWLHGLLEASLSAPATYLLASIICLSDDVVMMPSGKNFKNESSSFVKINSGKMAKSHVY